MNLPAYQTVPVTCPNCGNRFVSPVMTIVDTGQHPGAKNLLLSGQINIAACSQCGHAGVLNAPLVYHDPDKELLLTYVPSELGLPDLEQQRIIGDLTNRVMSALPAEQRKGYLLRPRNFLRLEGLIEAVLEADGITPEMLEAQRERASLLSQLMRATSEDARQIIAEENDARLDYEFFQLLALNIEMAEAEGQEQIAQQLLTLREQLLGWTTAGKELAARQEAIEELGTATSREDLLEKLVGAALAGQDAKVETMVAVARPAIDYVFFQSLTHRIEAEEQAGNASAAETLKQLRSTILDLTAQIDAELQKAREEAGQILREIVESPDLEQAILTRLELIDDLFLSVLASRLQAAEQAGQTETAQKLQRVGDIILKFIQESQPPEIQLINQLLNAEFPDGTQAMLEANHAQLGTELLEIMRLVGEDLAQTGRTSAAERLSQIRDQAQAMIG